MKVRYSTLALAELDSILATIQADDADAAVRFETRIRRVVERSATSQEVLRKWQEGPASGAFPSCGILM